MQSLLQYRRLHASVESNFANQKPRRVDSNFSQGSGNLNKTISPTREEIEESEGYIHKRDFDPETLRATSHRGDGSPDDYIVFVHWEKGHDEHDPRQWKLSKKIWVCALIWINIFVLEWASSADSRTSTKITEAFGVGKVAESLTSALYVIGIASGALFAGPIAESGGRNPVYIFSRVIHVAFILGSSFANNLGAQLACRFLAGLGASIILAIHGASIADLFDAHGRSQAWAYVATGSFFGTVAAPVVGGWIGNSASITWRWADWITAIMSFAAFVLSLFFLPETFAPILLSWKAKHMRDVTGNDRYISYIDLQDSFAARLKAAFKRAWLMTTQEPIVILLGLWLVIVYIVVFGFLQGFEFIFKDTFGFSEGLVGTAFLAIGVGVTLNTCLAPFISRIHDKQAAVYRQNHDIEDESKVIGGAPDVPPEKRLQPSFLVAPLFPIAMFWMGWTNYESISPWSDLGAASLFGFVWAGIYVACYQYILDVYGIYAGSALASITFFRFICAGSMVVISRPMYENLGVHWTLSLLGFLALLLMPAPFVFYKYGPWIRSKSHFAGDKNRGKLGHLDKR